MADMTEDEAYNALDAFEGDSQVFPEIEGCTENDVGWMKTSIWSLMPSDYNSLRDPDYWKIVYWRPPGVHLP